MNSRPTSSSTNIAWTLNELNELAQHSPRLRAWLAMLDRHPNRTVTEPMVKTLQLLVRAARVKAGLLSPAELDRPDPGDELWLSQADRVIERISLLAYYDNRADWLSPSAPARLGELSGYWQDHPTHGRRWIEPVSDVEVPPEGSGG